MTEKKWNGHVTLQQVYAVVERDYPSEEIKLSELKKKLPDGSLLPLGALAQSFTGLTQLELESTDAIEQIYIGWLAKVIHTTNNLEKLISLMERLLKPIEISTYVIGTETGVKISCDNFTAVVPTNLPEIAESFFSTLLRDIGSWKSGIELRTVSSKFEHSKIADVVTALHLLNEQINKSINGIGLHIEYQYERGSSVDTARFRLVQLNSEEKTSQQNHTNSNESQYIG